MLRYMRLYWHFLLSQLKVMVEYRTDFLIGVASVFFIQFTSVFFIKVVFDHIQSLNGWGYYEVLFVFGVASTGRSIHHIFFDNLWVLGSQYIRSGNFDRLLIRPINPLFHLVADKVQQDGFGSLLIGILILVTAMPHLAIAWTTLHLLLLVVMILSSGAIFVAINLFFATFSFWMVDSLPLVWTMFNISDFARYPITIYNKWFRVVLTWIIPYGFTAFFPSAYFVEASGYQLTSLLTPLVAVVSCLIAYAFWHRGLKSYTSTGV